MSKVKAAEKHSLTTDFTYQTAKPEKGLWHLKSFNVFMAVIKITSGVAAATALKAIEIGGPARLFRRAWHLEKVLFPHCKESFGSGWRN